MQERAVVETCQVEPCRVNDRDHSLNRVRVMRQNDQVLLEQKMVSVLFDICYHFAVVSFLIFCIYDGCQPDQIEWQIGEL